MALHLGVLNPLLQIVHNSNHLTLIKNGTWAISNLIKGRRLLELSLVKDATPVICEILMKETDTEILSDAAWSLAYLSRERNSVIETSGVIPHLVRHLE